MEKGVYVSVGAQRRCVDGFYAIFSIYHIQRSAALTRRD